MITPIAKILPTGSGERCVFCGSEEKTENVSTKIYPLIGPFKEYSSGFSGNHKICWKCIFISLFLPYIGYYHCYGKPKIFTTFFPYSNSLTGIRDFMATYSIRDMSNNENKWNTNIKVHTNGLNISFPYTKNEIQFILMHEIAQTVLKKNEAQIENNDNSGLMAFISQESIHEISYYIIEGNKNKIFRANSLHEYTGLSYMCQLFHQFKIENEDATIVSFFNSLHMRDGNKTFPYRGQICKNILDQKSIAFIMEEFLFKMMSKNEGRFFSRGENGHYNFGLYSIKKMFDFYEKFVQGGKVMNAKEQEVANKLGSSIGLTIAEREGGKKGDLFRLRKCRKKVDFLEELNRLQFRYDFIVKKETVRGVATEEEEKTVNGALTDSNFKEFKAFTMISALNSYISRKRKHQNQQNNQNQGENN